AVLDDVRVSPLVPDEQRGALEAFGTRAVLAIPLVKGGRLVAVLSIDDDVPRAWTPDELELAHETAERTWSAVARARAEASLRRSESRTRLALEASGTGSFIWYPEEDLGELDERAVTLIGFRPAGHYSLRGFLERVVHEEHRARLEAAVRRALDPAGSGALQE